MRVSIFDSARGRLGAGAAEYPLLRKKEDPDHATQRHADHMGALAEAMQAAPSRTAGIHGQEIEAIALDTTGSSVMPVDEDLEPLDDYYLWCDHRAWKEAAEITARRVQPEARGDRLVRRRVLLRVGICETAALAAEQSAKARAHGDGSGALRHGRRRVLCGITDPAAVSRSVCAMGHKWMWNQSLGGFPPDAFLASRRSAAGWGSGQAEGRYATSDQIAGQLTPAWAEKLGLRAGIPIPVGAFDAHWDAIGAGVRLGDVVNVVGTSTCIMAISEKPALIPGVCGVVPGSVHPGSTGIEAGLSATGDIFDAIARRAGTTVAELSRGLDKLSRGRNRAAAAHLG